MANQNSHNLCKLPLWLSNGANSMVDSMSDHVVNRLFGLSLYKTLSNKSQNLWVSQKGPWFINLSSYSMYLFTYYQLSLYILIIYNPFDL
jgi:hypothetical protein